jgi:signal transduction histidine kinase/streptogramin lyase
VFTAGLRPARLFGLAALLAGAGGLPRPAHALDPEKGLSECTVEVWGLRDGLTGTMVRSIAQTPDGYLWIAAFGAISRFDGARIVRIEIEPPTDSAGLSSDPAGLLFVAPRRGPIVCARGTSLVPCLPRPPVPPTTARNLVLRRDRAGTLWLSTETGLQALAGLPAGSDLGLASDGTLPGPFQRVSAISRDRRGRLFIGAGNGLWVQDGRQFHLYQGTAGPMAGLVRDIIESASGSLWVLTDASLVRIDDRGEWVHPLPPGMDVNSQSMAIEDRDGNIWIGSLKGLLRFRDGRFDLYTKAHGLPDDDITAVFEDREGSLWVGTRNGNLAQFTDRTVSSTYGPPTVAGESIESVSEDPTGAMWFGTRLGLHRWKDGIETIITRGNGLPGERVYATYPGRTGEVWIGSSGGLAVWREGRIQAPFGKGAPVFSLFRDSKDVLWVGTDEGLSQLKDGRLQPVPVRGDFQPAQVRGIQEDPKGILWITSSGGLGRVIGGRLEGVWAGPDISKADRGISRDPGGTLWFGAGTSLIRLRGGKFRAFTAAEGLPRDWLYQVIADDHGYLWFATSRSISRVSLADLDAVDQGKRRRLAVTSFDTTDTRRETAARRSRTPGTWKSRDGRLWFATLRGVITIEPQRVRTNKLPPSVLIEKALVDGRPALPGQDNQFAPGPRNLELHFGGVTLLEPRKVQHRYKLEGFDADWIEAGTRRVAYYTNVPAGSYRFRVQASNADGVWNEAGATLSLRLMPHFYRTFWFYGLVALTASALGYLLYRARLAQLRGQYLAVFAERSRLARELHDSLLQGMSAVSLELENIRATLPAEAASAARRLETVENALTTSLEETRRFVWNLREQKDVAGDLGLALSRLAGRLTEGRGVACKVNVTGEPVHLSHEAQGTLFKVAQEALTNALKHAGAGKVTLDLRYKGDGVELTVSDDGQGFAVDEAQGPRERHFGIVGMQERARRLGAQLVIDSRPSAGTQVRLALPLATRRTADV